MRERESERATKECKQLRKTVAVNDAFTTAIKKIDAWHCSDTNNNNSFSCPEKIDHKHIFAYKFGFETKKRSLINQPDDFERVRHRTKQRINLNGYEKKKF